uniref:CheR domain-containing protein n=1 Tax=Steinernema glaseri TaxID=37863 RepID=A0A1I7ZYU9_9BILA
MLRHPLVVGTHVPCLSVDSLQLANIICGSQALNLRGQLHPETVKAATVILTTSDVKPQLPVLATSKSEFLEVLPQIQRSSLLEMSKLSIEHAEQEFISLLERVEPRQVAQFLQWIGDSFSVVEGDRGAHLTPEDSNDVDAAKADCELQDIAQEIRSLLPTSAVLPSENVLWPVNGIDSDCHPNTTVHVDGFLFDENDVDDLVDQGLISRNFCKDCGSHKTSPLTFISHSLGVDQLRYMFTSLVPLQSPQMAGRIVLDIGSRLGTVLYGVHYHSGGAVKAVGIEMNRDFCDLQNRFIQSRNMTNVQVICDNLLNQKDVVASADVVVMNNVFSFFMPEEGQIKCWRFLAEHMKPGCVLLHNPSVESVVEHLDLGFTIPQWLDHIPTDHQAALFAGSNEEVFEDCEKLSMYQVRPRS